jgi:hypothetical protein
MLIPVARGLTETIQASPEAPFAMFFAVGGLNTCGWFQVNFFFQVAMKKCCLHVQFMEVEVVSSREGYGKSKCFVLQHRCENFFIIKIYSLFLMISVCYKPCFVSFRDFI